MKGVVAVCSIFTQHFTDNHNTVTFMKSGAIFLILMMFAGHCAFLEAQETSYTTQRYTIKPDGTVRVAEIHDDWLFSLRQTDGISEGNPDYRYYLQELKALSAQRFPRRQSSGKGENGMLETNQTKAATPEVLRNFQGNAYSGSAPNDNTLAISNGGQLISAINTNIYFYDLTLDSLMKAVTLNNFSSTLTGISAHQYDPKLLYDPEQDKFILVYLAGSSSDATKKTNIIVAFSKTSDMLGDWNLYTLPGNPLNDTSWTDYPALALTRDELFITGNLLNYGTSWQTSFRQTVVWQVNKFNGYAGDSLETRLWKDIVFDGVNIRNINPIQGGETLDGPNIYMLSNRNFTLYSDSVFLMEITGNLKKQDAELKVTCLKADPGYGAPPDAKQPKSNDKLATNDARVLGGFLRNNTIQFVANTIDTTTGGAVIYHGIIRNVSSRPELKGKLLTEPGMEFGYPNISYSGNTRFSQQAIIGCNHTGDTIYPGVSVFATDGSGGYSDRVVVKQGTELINIFSGTYERWGDYTGNQRRYNEPGKVWVSGMFGIKVGLVKRLSTQIAEVQTGIPEQPMVIKSTAMEATLYPNPLTDLFAMDFTLDQAQHITIEIRSLTGQLLHRFVDEEMAPGRKSLTFSTAHLAQGTHLLMITGAEGKVLFLEKIIRL